LVQGHGISKNGFEEDCLAYLPAFSWAEGLIFRGRGGPCAGSGIDRLDKGIHEMKNPSPFERPHVLPKKRGTGLLGL